MANMDTPLSCHIGEEEGGEHKIGPIKQSESVVGVSLW